MFRRFPWITFGPPEPSTEPAVREAREVARKLGDVWEDDGGLIQRFFPVTKHVRQVFKDMQNDLTKPYHGDHWVGVKRNPAKLSQLYTPLNNLINKIIRAFSLENDGGGNRRLCINTSRSKVYPKPFPLLWPALLLAGSGKHLINSGAHRPLPDYTLAISPIEIYPEGEDEDDKERKEMGHSQSRLATYMRDLFECQLNRRFVFGLILSQKSVTVYLFDRSGILRSKPLDYHKSPEQFCAIIAGLASLDPDAIGLDSSWRVDEHGGYIRMVESIGRNRTKNVEYKLERLLHVSSFPVGRATTCLSVLDPVDENIKYAMKDSWVDVSIEGKESEASLLEHARTCGVTEGLPVFKHFEEVRVRNGSRGSRLDRVLLNRNLAFASTSNDRIHTRALMTPVGKPLLEFTSRQEFLIAYRDAFKAHRDLYQRAGVLHRDIKPQNILIVSSEDNPPKGILIDFDHSIRVSDKSPYSKKTKIVGSSVQLTLQKIDTHGQGTYVFMSRSVLKEENGHSAMDDIESFYYVLVYFCLAFTRPGSELDDFPHPIDEWTRRSAASCKGGFLQTECDIEVQFWWGHPFQSLIEKIHAEFRRLCDQEYVATFDSKPVPEVDVGHIYDLFLNYIEETLLMLKHNSEPENADIPSNISEVSAALPSGWVPCVTTLAGGREMRKRRRRW